MHPENCQPCFSPTMAVTFCEQDFFFFLLFACMDLGNKSLALVTAQGHTMQCDQCYQIVTKTNLESLGLQPPGKVFWIFYEVYLMQSAGLCSGVTFSQVQSNEVVLLHFCAPYTNVYWAVKLVGIGLFSLCPVALRTNTFQYRVSSSLYKCKWNWLTHL